MQTKKKILIIHSNMELGGAETSLLSLLYAFDYSKVEVSLFLLQHTGVLLPLLPKEIHVFEENKKYRSLMEPMKKLLIDRNFTIFFARMVGKGVCYISNCFKHYSDYGYIVKQNTHFYSVPFLPRINGHYDLAISYIDPHFILTSKVDSKIKVGWFHTDYDRITGNQVMENRMWSKCDYIVNVSSSCKEKFDFMHKNFINKSLVIENILSKEVIRDRAKEFEVHKEMDKDVIQLLSIGRYSKQKNFDNVPDICKRILDSGLNLKWYIIGFGGDEELIRQKVRESGMEEHVIMLGKKDNPYPYIKACDYYIQPSRYEGKAVTVREAQILEKPVIITNYSTSSSQLEDGIDGVIVPMDNEGCAKEIVDFINNKELQEKIINNLKQRDYSNASEVEKIYALMED